MPGASQAGAHISHTCNSATRSAAEQDKAQSDPDGVAQHRQSATFRPLWMRAGIRSLSLASLRVGLPVTAAKVRSLAHGEGIYPQLVTNNVNKEGRTHDNDATAA